eukprot:evm.model.scf_2351.3 EVM.evm.TU.scf_2351.3   scf_2351:17628-18092(-)
MLQEDVDFVVACTTRQDVAAQACVWRSAGPCIWSPNLVFCRQNFHFTSVPHRLSAKCPGFIPGAGCNQDDQDDRDSRQLPPISALFHKGGNWKRAVAGGPPVNWRSKQSKPSMGAAPRHGHHKAANAGGPKYKTASKKYVSPYSQRSINSLKDA